MYETYYDKLQPYFGQENLHLHYMDTDSFILSVNTKDFFKDLKKLEDFFLSVVWIKITNYLIIKLKT